MNNDLLKRYISDQPTKIVTKLDFATGKLAYDKIIQCQKRTDAKPEELCRAYLLTKLVNELGYDPAKIEIEHEYTAGRPHTITSRIDVIVRDGNGDAFLFVEVKNEEEYATIDKDNIIEEQLFKLAGMERTDGHKVKYLVLYTTNDATGTITDECIIIDNQKYSTYADWEVARDFTNTLPARYGKAQKKPYIKGSEKDLETNFSHGMLLQLQKDLHNVLWGGGGTDDNDVFSSLTNLILSKIQDEDEKEDGDTYDFQSMTFAKDGDEEFETNEKLFDRINELYRRALKSKLYILDEKELGKSYVVDTKKFSLSKLKYAVQKLEGLSFVDGKNSLSGKDILGDFFEGIIRDGFKQSKGQFFTHTNIVKFMLYAIQADKLAIKRIKDDKEIPYMIDPSAGSGTFLIEYMKFITENMKYRNRNSLGYNNELGTSRAVKDKVTSDWFFPDHRENKWAQTYIYGSEINFNLGTATKVNMILHGDGSTNIFVKDGLLPFAKYEKETAPNALNGSVKDTLYQEREVNGQFDLILTNPPFSVELDNDTNRNMSVFGIDALFFDPTQKMIFFGESKVCKTIDNAIKLVNRSFDEYESQISEEYKLVLSNNDVFRLSPEFTSAFEQYTEVCISFEDFVKAAEISQICVPAFIAHGNGASKNTPADFLDKMNRKLKRNTFFGLETKYLFISLPIIDKEKMTDVIRYKSSYIEFDFYNKVDLIRYFMRCDNVDESLINTLHDRLLKNIEILYYLTSPSKKMLKDMGIYEGDIDQIISIIGEDFTSIAELQQLLKEHLDNLSEISVVSRYIINRLLN